MGNPITPQLKTGTLGELFVQIKLFEYGIQAASPIKDSGNDLVAIKEETFKLIQVKTGLNKKPRRGKLPKIYHLLALVELIKKRDKILFDESKIWIVEKNSNKKNELTQNLVNKIWDNC